ncbi:MAG: GMC family oxidoreductase [Saprospiraceae bacterium]|nr:GMC family oxidoreductase [Saprospiraceae bacterium]
MLNFITQINESQTYDAIVVGSGISGGWAAKEFCEKGFKTLVLERGRMVRHVTDYPTMNHEHWDFEHRGRLTYEDNRKYHIQARSGFINEANKHFHINDIENPYTEIKRFDWIRGDQVGGRSLLWGKQCYRWSDLDFEANAKEGIGVDWPIRYKDIENWYTYVEKYVGISGEKLGLAHLPDGHFLPPMELNCIEKHVKTRIEKEFKERYLTIGRVAHLTEPINGRGKCQYRNRCSRGCPFGAYFSSNAVTLPAADATGNLTIRPDSAVHSIIYDAKTGKATGVRTVDTVTHETTEFFARVIFLNASTLGSTAILLNSTSDRFPNGMGNDSGELGHNLMDHHYRLGAMGSYEGFEDQYYKGRRPNGIYIPRFRNLNGQTKHPDFLRGYGYQGGGSRGNWGGGVNKEGMGADFKENLFQPGGWGMTLVGFGECLPYHENKVTLNHDLKDKAGLPTLAFDCEFKTNEMSMRKQIKDDAAEMLEKAGLKNVTTFDRMGAIGVGIHEMGTARMGKDPKTSVLNAQNQVHAVPNVFVTDGACMTSSSCVNPSITYMALTARAVDFAVQEIKANRL